MRPCRLGLAVALAGLLPAPAAHAQTRWIIDSKTSLAWWQMSPHLNHLWATTCPEEPSWRPGENRSPGWHINRDLKPPSVGYNNVDDTVHVPLYPRDRPHPVCGEAVEGQALLPDTVTWRGAGAEVTVRADALITGEAMRDILMHQILETKRFPDIHFTLDSLAGLTRRAGWFFCTAFGTLTVRGVQKPIVAAVRAFPDGGGMRVLAKWRVPATTLLHELTPKLHRYGLGANTNLWHDFFMGADLVFLPETRAAN